MVETDRPVGNSYLKSVAVGSFGGICLQLLISVWLDPPPIENAFEFLLLPYLIFTYGLVAMPFVAIGLGVFGIPARRLLHRKANSWWLGWLALALGAIAGKLIFYGIDHTIFSGSYSLLALDPLDIGPIYGTVTAVAFWHYSKREIG